MNEREIVELAVWAAADYKKEKRLAERQLHIGAYKKDHF